MLPSELSIEDRRLFWRDYDKWCALFSAPEVDAQLAALSILSIVDEYKVPLRDWEGHSLHGKCWQNPQRKLGTQHTYYTFHRDGWERTENVPCDIYMVSAQYQSTKHDGMVKAIMLARYPWLAEFKCSFYSLHFYNDHAEEFYVRTAKEHGPHGGHRSLYVPYDAFFAHDAAAIEKRTESYLKSYTKSDEVWQAMKDDANVVKFLAHVKES